MFNRVIFPFIVLFWIVMNVLLWRSEFGGGTELGSAVPPESVWERVLTAPDDSSLAIYRDGTKIGYCRWTPSVGGEGEGTGRTIGYEPEGRVRHLTGYSIQVEGNLLFDPELARLRFSFHGQFDTNLAWTGFEARVMHRPMVLELASSAADQELKIRYESEKESWERRFHFSDFSDPARLLRRSGLGVLGNWLPTALPVALPNVQAVSAGLEWEVWNDWLKLGHSRIRVYRLRARLLDKHQIVVIVSRVGEILRMELPNNILLTNDALPQL